MIEEAKARAIAINVFEHFNRGDLVALAALFHPEMRGEWPFPPPGGPSVCCGRTEVLEIFNNAKNIITNIQVTLKQIYWVQAEAILIIEGSGIATMSRGSPYNNEYIFVIAFRDDLVVLWREYFNPLIVQRALLAEAQTADTGSQYA